MAGGADHLGFKVIMLAPAWVQRHTGASYLVPAFFVSLFSVANIFLIWRIARRAGADEREAPWATAAMAASNSMFYWARHVMPFDVAMFWALACLYVGLKPAARWWDSVLAGALGCAAFVTYNGYWAMVACALTAHVLSAWPAWKSGCVRAVAGLVGLVGSFALLLGFVCVGLDVDLLGLVADENGGAKAATYLSFSGSITQGDFHEGAQVFFDYLWRTERATSLVWAVALVASGWWFARCDPTTRRRGILWAGCIVALMTILIVGSNVLEKFVIYGRLARQVVPFCSLLVGWTAARIFARERQAVWKERLALMGLAGCAAGSMAAPLQQEFPRSFHLRASHFVTSYRNLHAPADPMGTMPEKFRFLYNDFIWPEADRTPQPQHIELMAEAHPLQWRPYLYEGFNAAQRAQIEATDIRMRLILLKD
ncbi:MAG: hypothetical protein H7343_22490 [Undibacterium sp.]|nr:hypothetical protein [Opitutaceae bacterium]